MTDQPVTEVEIESELEKPTEDEVTLTKDDIQWLHQQRSQSSPAAGGETVQKIAVLKVEEPPAETEAQPEVELEKKIEVEINSRKSSRPKLRKPAQKKRVKLFQVKR